MGDVMMSHIALLEKEFSSASGVRAASSTQGDPASASIVGEEEGTQEAVKDTLERSRKQTAEVVLNTRLSGHLGGQMGVEVAGPTTSQGGQKGRYYACPGAKRPAAGPALSAEGPQCN